MGRPISPMSIVTRFVHLSAIWLVSAFVTLPALAAPSKVWVVDPFGGPGVDFTRLQDAIDAVPDGDVLYLRKGTYQGNGPGAVFRINGKSLTIESEPGQGGAMIHAKALIIEGLGPKQSVRMRGFQNSVLSIALIDNSGSVWLEDIHAVSGAVGGPGITIRGSRSVVLTRITMYGQISDRDEPSKPALEVRDSVVHAYESTFVGGSAGHTFHGFRPQPGAPGAQIVSGLLYASGCRFEGGTGGDGDNSTSDCQYASGANGGDGMVLQSGQPSVYFLATTAMAGEGGEAHGPSGCPDGDPGLDQRILSGQLVDWGRTSRTIAIRHAPKEGDRPYPIRMKAEPGDFITIMVSHGNGAQFIPTFFGASVMSWPLCYLIPCGKVDASGHLVEYVSIPPLPAGVDARTVFLQGVYLGASEAVLGNGTMLTIFDSRF